MLDGYEKLSAKRRRKAISEWLNSFALHTIDIAGVLMVPKRTVDNWRAGSRAPSPYFIPVLIKAEPKLKKLAAKK